MALSLVLSSVDAYAAHPNEKVIITDLLDDDIRALVHLLTDPEVRSSIRALVVSTGNVQLKAAIARRIVAGLGLDTPVYAGTSTDLSANKVIAFAGNYEKEGAPLLTNAEIREVRKLNGKSG